MSIILFSTLLYFPINTLACPNLAGDYWCLSNDGQNEPQLDVLTMKQFILADSPKVTHFSTHYLSIPGIEDTFDADEVGIPDQWGWITKCTADKVISLRDDQSALSELYLDKDDSLVRSEKL